MKSKYTNQELYSWMIGQISAIYFQFYQLAYDLTKRAEIAYRFELGLEESNFIQFGYWDSLKHGVFAGERLRHDIERLEVAHLEQNEREDEITRTYFVITT
jgi:Tc toxin complex TcA C-terminal TcB-binding domain